MPNQLNATERRLLAEFHRQGLSAGEIGRRLMRHKSTIYRELKRNGQADGYCSVTAQAQAQARRRKPRSKLDADAKLRDVVLTRLINLWSPEQIAGRLPQTDNNSFSISHTSIYRWIARSPDRRHWESFLRLGKRRTEPETRGKIPARADIAGRPTIVDERGRFGDWEGDTIVGKQRLSGLVTMVDRKSGFALIGKVNRLKARNVGQAIERRMKKLPAGLRHTSTFDNGKEFADHQRVAKATDIDIYFARPYHAWERGCNENFNGLVRQFFPKGTDFRNISPQEVARVTNLLNDRPRKRLGYKTPREVLARYHPVAFEV
jgi:transposase, IS30 family